MDDRRLKGVLGEQIAARFLREKGYEIIAANFKSKCGEIDIIAKKAELIVFAEVKTRQKDTLIAPYLSVNQEKRRKIILTAQVFLKLNPLYSKCSYRFDIIEIFLDGQRFLNLNHLENAYTPQKYKKLDY